MLLDFDVPLASAVSLALPKLATKATLSSKINLKKKIIAKGAEQAGKGFTLINFR